VRYAVGCEVGEDIVSDLDAGVSDWPAVDVPRQELNRISVVVFYRRARPDGEAGVLPGENAVDNLLVDKFGIPHRGEHLMGEQLRERLSGKRR